MLKRDDVIATYPVTEVHRVAFMEPEEVPDPNGIKFPLPTGKQYSDEVFEEHLMRSGGGPEDMSLLHSMELIRWMHNDILDELERLHDEIKNTRHKGMESMVRKLHKRTAGSTRNVASLMAYLNLSVSMTLNRTDKEAK